MIHICVDKVNSGKKFIWVQTASNLFYFFFVTSVYKSWYHILRMQYGTEIRLFNGPCFILILNRGQSYFYYFYYSNFAFLEGSEQACRKKSLKMLGIFQQDYLKFNGTTWMWKALPTSRSFAFVCFLLLQTSAIKEDIWLGVLLMHSICRTVKSRTLTQVTNQEIELFFKGHSKCTWNFTIINSL